MIIVTKVLQKRVLIFSYDELFNNRDQENMMYQNWVLKKRRRVKDGDSNPWPPESTGSNQLNYIHRLGCNEG